MDSNVTETRLVQNTFLKRISIPPFKCKTILKSDQFPVKTLTLAARVILLTWPSVGFSVKLGPLFLALKRWEKICVLFQTFLFLELKKSPPLYVVLPKKCFNWEAKYITSQGVDIYNVLEYFPCFPNKEKFVVKSDCFVFLPITADFSITSNFDQNYHQPCLLWWKMISFVNQIDSGQNGPGLFMG